MSRLGAVPIEIRTEHLLLGVMRQPTGLVRQICAPLPTEKIRSEIENMPGIHESIPTSAEVPFAPEAKRALNFAAEEADRLLHSYIGPEHLVLGLLRFSLICDELDALRWHFGKG